MGTLRMMSEEKCRGANRCQRAGHREVRPPAFSSSRKVQPHRIRQMNERASPVGEGWGGVEREKGRRGEINDENSSEVGKELNYFGGGIQTVSKKIE